MPMKILKNKYVTAWVVIFALDSVWWEFVLYSAILSALGVGGFWWKEGIW